MASMLVLGVAGSVIAVGNGTFAAFNATTSNTANTFATGDISLKLTDNGSTVCTGTSGTALGVATGCGVVVSLGSNMVAGDSKLGLFTLDTTGSARAADITLTTDTSCSGCAGSLLSSTLPSATPPGLAMLIFRCTDGSGAAAACSGTNTPVQLYPSTSPCSPGSISAFSNTVIGSNAGTSVAVNSHACTGGPIVQSNGSLFSALGIGSTENLAAVVYLPSAADNTMAHLTSTLEFSFVATQVNGTPQ
jgi:hypothetical protein